LERSKPLFAILFVASAFAVLFWSVRQSKTADQTAPGLIAAGNAKNAIDFTLPLAQTGQPLHLSEAAKAQPLVLDFWATWCGPCREELPHLEALSRKYQGKVAFYGVNSSDPPSNIVAFSRQEGITFPTLSDAKRTVAFLYGVDSIPLLIVVDTNGKVRSVISGVDPAENIETSLSKTLDTLLAEKQAAR